MAIPFYSNIDLNGNELQNYKVQNLDQAPTNPTTGQQYYNTTDNKLYYYNGTEWVDLTKSNEPTESGVPLGTIVNWPSSSLPVGWLKCDGSAISRTDYSSLFAIIGTTFGGGDGSTTFNLPNITDKNILGNGTINETGGNNSITLAVENLPSHYHDYYFEHSHDTSVTIKSGGAHTHSFSDTSSSAGAHTHSFSDTTSTKTLKGGFEARRYGNSSKQTDVVGIKATSGTYGVFSRIVTAWGGSHQVLASNGSATNPSVDAIDFNGTHNHTVSGNTGSAGAHTHTVSGTTGSSGAHTHSATATTSNAAVSGTTEPAGSGQAVNIQNPYIRLNFIIKALNLNGSASIDPMPSIPTNQTMRVPSWFPNTTSQTEVTDYISYDKFNNLAPGDVLEIESGTSAGRYNRTLLLSVYTYLRQGNAGELLKLIAYLDNNGNIARTTLMGIASNTSQVFIYVESGSEGVACFTDDTLVYTEDGYKAIEDIELGDKVYSYSEKTMEVELKEVDKLVNHMANEIYTIIINNGETIETTWSHPFYVVRKGKVLARDLQCGDMLVTKDGQTPVITGIDKQEKQQVVYEIRVKDYNTYFITNSNIFVYNEDSVLTD